MQLNAAVFGQTTEPSRQSLDVVKVYLRDSLYPDEVLVRTISAGLCHSDLHIIAGDSDSYQPIILGHEALFEVIDTGAHVTNVKRGDIAIPGIVPSCGHCRYCRSNRSSLCNIPFSVVAGHDIDGRFNTYVNSDQENPIGRYCFVGSFSEYSILKARQLAKIPERYKETPELCILNCAVVSGAGTILNDPRLTYDTSIAIIGFGGVGASALIGARIKGIRDITILETNSDKRTLAAELGATAFLATQDAVDRGLQFDCVVECVGLPETIMSSVSLVNKCGYVKVVGMPKFNESIGINFWDVVTKNLTVVGSVHGDGDFLLIIERLLSAYDQHRLPLAKLISRTASLEDINELIREMINGRSVRGIISF